MRSAPSAHFHGLLHDLYPHVVARRLQKDTLVLREEAAEALLPPEVSVRVAFLGLQGSERNRRRGLSKGNPLMTAKGAVGLKIAATLERNILDIEKLVFL
jgi:hypothetical protein